MYLHARMFCTLANTTSIPVGAMYLHSRTFCTLSDMILYPWLAQIFTVITEVWPPDNRAVVTNNLSDNQSCVNQGFPVYHSHSALHCRPSLMIMILILNSKFILII